MSIPSIPNVPDTVPAAQRPFMAAMREAVMTMLGQNGDSSLWAVRRNDLLQLGLLYQDQGNVLHLDNYYAYPDPIIGLTATSLFSGVFLSWTPPTYTQAGGPDHVEIWAVTGSTFTFANATQIGVTAASSFVDPCQLGVTRSYWVFSVAGNGNRQTSPTGGLNGVQATVGKVGNSDLGDLIIEAGNLADGAVTTAKIHDAAIDVAKFAATIEPVSLVTSVPLTKTTNNIFNTTDQKLYRWNGTAYIKDVDGADLIAGSIIAGKIAAGAIGATEIAAGAITASKLAIADFQNFVGYPKGDSAEGFTAQFLPSSSAVAFWPADSNSGYALKFVCRDSNYGPKFACTPGDQFRVSMDTISYLNGASVYDFKIGLSFQDETGANISWLGASRPQGTSGFYAVNGIVTVPAEAATARVWVQINGPGATDFTGQAGKAHYATNLQIRRMNGGQLIVDGAVQANHLAANSIAVGTAAIQDGAIVNAMIANLAVDNAKIANLNVNKLEAGSLQVNAYIQSSNYVANTSGFRISYNGVAEFQNVKVRGDVQATSINGIIVGAGNIIDGAVTAAKISVSNLEAVSAYMGNVAISTSGSLRSGQTAYNTGTGFWLGISGGVPKFSIGNPAGSSMQWDGVNLIVNGATLDTYSASVGGGDLAVSVANGKRTYGSRTVTAVGGAPPYSYIWAIAFKLTDNNNYPSEVFVSAGATSATVTVGGLGQDNIVSGRVVCYVTDSNARVVCANFLVSATHGSPP